MSNQSGTLSFLLAFILFVASSPLQPAKQNSLHGQVHDQAEKMAAYHTYESHSDYLELQAQVNIFHNDPALKHASWSFLVIDLASDTPILAHNHRLSLVPASVQKLMTTAGALLIFGPDHRFVTTLHHDGYIDNQGRLHGNIYISGSGDPGFGSAFWNDTLSYETVAKKWVQEIKSAGIRHIGGHIMADDRLFDKEMTPRKWLWEDMGNYFGAGSNGLTVNENAFTIFFDAGHSTGDPVSIRSVVPEIPGMILTNEVSTGPRGSGDQVYIFGAPYQHERLLTGTVPLGATNFPVRGSMPDPPLFFSRYLASQLQQNGIPVDGQGTTILASNEKGSGLVTTAEERKQLGVWHSPPLSDIIYRTNMASVNVYAENLLKLMGLEAGKQGTTTNGIKALTNIWTERGMVLSGLKLHDGSGLAPSNRVTAEQIGFVLSHMWRQETYPHFLNSLPVAGRSGSLTGLFRNTRSEGILHAKSGFLDSVRSYAGYTTMQNGSEVAFVLIVNNYEGTPAIMRSKMIRLLDAITSSGN